jgi:hypothetical protein
MPVNKSSASVTTYPRGRFIDETHISVMTPDHDVRSSADAYRALRKAGMAPVRTSDNQLKLTVDEDMPLSRARSVVVAALEAEGIAVHPDVSARHSTKLSTERAIKDRTVIVRPTSTRWPGGVKVRIVAFGPDVRSGVRASLPIGSFAAMHPDAGKTRGDGTIRVHEDSLSDTADSHAEIKCPSPDHPLYPELRRLRQVAHDTSWAASQLAQDAERAFRNGDCDKAAELLEATKRTIAKERRKKPKTSRR